VRSLLKKIFSREPVLLIEYLGDNAGEFKAERDKLTVKILKNPYLDELTLELRSIGVFGMEHQLTLIGKTTIVNSTEMRSKHAELYRRLKTLECELEAKGFFFKKFHFKPMSSLSILVRNVEGFSPSRKLADALSRDNEVVRLLKEVKPDELYVALHSGYASAVAGVLDIEGPMLEFYRSPSEISWFIILKIPVPVSVIPKDDFLLAYRLLSSVARIAVSTTVDEARAIGCRLPRSF